MPIDLRDLPYGIEIEMVGSDRRTVAMKVAAITGLHPPSVASDRERPVNVEQDGRGYHWRDRHSNNYWRVVYDGSLSGGEHSAELVTPPLAYARLADLPAITHACREIGCSADSSCGLHVHVDASHFDARALRNLTYLIYGYEEYLVQALAILPRRRGEYAKKISRNFVDRVKAHKPTTPDAFGRCWYDVDGDDDVEVEGNRHYHETRYYGLNLHAVWNKGTVEFRYFNGTLHAGKIKAYVQLALAMSAYALNVRTVKGDEKPYVARSAKYDFRVLLNRMGLVGPEFETARYHLLHLLPGLADVKGR